VTVGCAGAAQLFAAHGEGGGLKAGLAGALVVGCGAVFMRRNHPLPAAIVAGAVWFVPGLAVGPRWANGAPAAFIFAFVLLAYTVGADEGGAKGVVGLAAIVLGFSTGDFADPVPMFVLTIPAWVAGQVVQSRSRVAAQLSARAHELDEQHEAFAREAVRYERARIARELHDIVAHSLSMMVVQAGAGRRLLDADPTRAAESLEHIGAAARQAEQELRGLLQLLGDDAPPDHRHGLRLIDELVRRAGATGLPVTCRFTGEHDDLPGDLADAAYRIAQEGLTNALKHAPGAPVAITVAVTGLAVAVTVENGPSRSQSPLEGAGGHHGVRGIRERVESRGGSLDAGPRPDGGWRLEARLPRRVGNAR
jgi:signal transduction histidine kinase